MEDSMINKKFNNLFVVEKTTNKKNGSYLYKCLCDCGNITYETSARIKNGSKKSCGCLKISSTKHLMEISKKHGKSNHRLYRIFIGMKERCNSKTNKNYDKYGGRGIIICREWLDDFMNFYNWSINNGYEETLTIDRINNDGNYEPNNCRWVDMKTQANNRSNNSHIEYNNKKYTYSEFGKEFNINQTTLSKIKNRENYTIEEIIIMSKSITTKELAEQLGISSEKVLNMVKSGDIPVKFKTKNNRYFFDKGLASYCKQ